MIITSIGERLTNKNKYKNLIGHFNNSPNNITYNPGPDEFIPAYDKEDYSTCRSEQNL